MSKHAKGREQRGVLRPMHPGGGGAYVVALAF